MVRLTVWTLGETKKEVEPATNGGQGPELFFFSAGAVAKTHRRESRGSHDGAIHARSVLQNDPAPVPLSIVDSSAQSSTADAPNSASSARTCAAAHYSDNTCTAHRGGAQSVTTAPAQGGATPG